LLSDDFDGGLAVIFFLDGHIEVVNEDDALVLAILGSVPAFSALGGHLGFDLPNWRQYF